MGIFGRSPETQEEIYVVDFWGTGEMVRVQNQLPATKDEQKPKPRKGETIDAKNGQDYFVGGPAWPEDLNNLSRKDKDAIRGRGKPVPVRVQLEKPSTLAKAARLTTLVAGGILRAGARAVVNELDQAERIIMEEEERKREEKRDRQRQECLRDHPPRQLSPQELRRQEQQAVNYTRESAKRAQEAANRAKKEAERQAQRARWQEGQSDTIYTEPFGFNRPPENGNLSGRGQQPTQNPRLNSGRWDITRRS